MLVGDGGDESEERDGQHPAIAHAEKGEIHEGLPSGGGQSKCGDERAGQDKNAFHADVEEVVSSRAAHDKARAKRAHGTTQRLRDETYSGFGGGHSFGLEIYWSVEEHGIDGHGGKPVGQTGGEDGAIQEKANRNDGFGGDAVFDVDEGRQKHE